MSPKQARGKAADKKTDIWAFGCCLYEALTGKAAFLGETCIKPIGPHAKLGRRAQTLLSDELASSHLLNLASNEGRSVNTLRCEEIMAPASDSKKSLVVAAVDCKGPQVVDLETGSRATTSSIYPAVLALIRGSHENALSYFRRNISRGSFSI